MTRRDGIARWLAVSWTLFTAIVLLVIALGIVAQPAFPLGLGPLRTTGRAGLWFTLLPATLAFAGAVLFGSGSRLAAGLLATYSAFWAGVVASSLPLVWNAKRSFCLNSLGMCITSPWLGRLTTVALLAPFALAGLWFGRALGGRRAPGGGGR